MIINQIAKGGGASTADATATAANILTPKTAYIATGKVIGTMANRSGTNQMSSGVDIAGSTVIYYIPENGYYDISATVYCPFINLASTIGLTAAKIVTGNTILGIVGTG